MNKRRRVSQNFWRGRKPSGKCQHTILPNFSKHRIKSDDTLPPHIHQWGVKRPWVSLFWPNILQPKKICFSIKHHAVQAPCELTYQICTVSQTEWKQTNKPGVSPDIIPHYGLWFLFSSINHSLFNPDSSTRISHSGFSANRTLRI